MAEVGGMLASAILKVVAQQIGSAIGGQIKLQWDFSKDLEDMKMTLESVAAVLKDAERRSIQEADVLLWLMRLKNAMYDISDMIDEFEADTKLDRRQFPFLTIVPKITLANKMKKMREELKNITNQRQRFNFNIGSSSNVQQVTDKRETDSKVEEVVGRIYEKEKILAFLSNIVTHGTIILPFYGIGGIGKTTLARWIFNSAEFKDYCKVWVYVSQVFDYNKIGNSIISQVSEEQSQINVKQMIHNRLTRLLADKKILIILDDLWEKDQAQLEELKGLLKVGQGSMVVVIVTTRDQEIADKISTVEPYKLEPLSNDMCWTIMKQQCAFHDRPDREFLELTGRAIAEKCGGLALAAKAVGYMLKSMTLDEWESLKKNDIWNAFASASSDASSLHHVPTSLKLSYSSMLPHLKLCFAYCAIFPKGKIIDKDDLIYQWISLGFIEPDNIRSIWQIGEKYVCHLLGMSFLQHRRSPLIPGAYKKDATLFEMHDLIHDLARSIIVDELLDASKEGNKTGASSIRYALLPDCSKPLMSWINSPQKIRAIHFMDCYKIELNGAAISSAKLLRVLDLSECFIEKLPDSIGKLKQLSYLKAPGIKNREIPISITKLSKLKYLILNESSGILELPNSIGEMEGLMHLDLSGCSGIKELPGSFSKLKSLVHLDLSNCCSLTQGLDALGSLTKLRYLSLRRPSNGLRKFQTLAAIGNLAELRYLNLSSFTYAPWHLKPISSLCNLEHLDLSQNVGLEYLPVCLGSLRKLHTLDLSGCRSLRKVPECICEISSLKILIVKDCHEMRSSSGLHFEVEAGYGELSSSLVLLRDRDPPNVLKIKSLENVKSEDEAQTIKLKEKRTVVELRFQWTRGAKRFVDDIKVLEELVPPMRLNSFDLLGYESDNFPSWVKSIAVYLPILTKITLFDLPNCNSLPPLGQLQKLRELIIGRMDSITKIGTEFYGSARGFPELNEFCLIEMKGLEEWETTNSYSQDGANQSMFPTLEALTIRDCPKLKLKPCPPRAKHWKIENSDNVISSWGERGQTCASSSVSQTFFRVKFSKLPLYQWRLLHHLPALTRLSMEHCSYLASSSPDIIQELSTLQSLSLQYIDQPELPKWLGELSSLKELDIRYCRVIKNLPDGVLALTKLEELYIYGCPELKRWCELEQTKRNLAHIKISTADYTNKLYRVYHSEQ